MATIYGILGISDRDATVDSVGQGVVWDAMEELFRRHNEDMEAAVSFFVQETTTNHTERYYLPSGGQMQRQTRLSRPGAVKPIGEYDVAYDLEMWGDQVAGDRVALAYLTLNKLNSVIRGIEVRHANTVRQNILQHLLNKTNATFVDELRGSLTIRRLANTDSTTYPPVIGSDTGADDNMYIVSGYTAANISDTNNPFPTIRAKFTPHFGQGTPVALLNSTHTTKIEALVDFIPISDPFVREGDATPTIIGGGPSVPGRIIGRVNGVWVSEWDWMPANYIYAQDIDQPAPLKKRIDSVEVPGRGMLELVTEQEEYPLLESFWALREGYGVANRLNGVAMELTTDATYDTPAAFA